MTSTGSPAASSPDTVPVSEIEVFSISPLIRLTLLSFYTALTLPLPFLARVTAAPVPVWLLVVGLGLGAIALHGALSQQVVLDSQGIQVTYPAWIRWLLRQSWYLPWSQATALKPRSTGQGGLVYYFVGPSAEGSGAAQRAYLLPMRVSGFARLVNRVEHYTGIDTRDVRPLAQPWMYLILLGLTLLLLLIDGWTIATALQIGAI
jgi:hypothetical protein